MGLDAWFVEQQLHPQALDETELNERLAHLKGCEHCVVTLNTICKTIEIYRSHEIYDLPADLREQLHAAILARCKRGC